LSALPLDGLAEYAKWSSARGPLPTVHADMPRPRAKPKPAADPKAYAHPAADLAARPEIGTQAHFKKAKRPTEYRFDSSLAPELCWDGENPPRELAESLLDALAKAADALAAAQDAAAREGHLATARDLLRRLRALSRPFLNWSDKAERLSFEVPTLPLFVHERLSTKAIIETLKGHKRDKQESFLDALFTSPERSLVEQTLRAYEHRDAWVNRLILGDSLVVMNSLLRFESLGGQVQCIYLDPPYGVKFGSNFQPFIRKRDVKHGEDDDFTREPEMVQAYRDTWELGLHSYLTYLRDRLLLARELLAPTGSIFVQISDENLHHVREVRRSPLRTSRQRRSDRSPAIHRRVWVKRRTRRASDV
jgi:adenine-specific DNA-methyltransferase